MAAKRDLHIYMDKPGGWKLSEFSELVSLVREKKAGILYRIYV